MAETIGLVSALVGLASELFVSVLRTCEFISSAQGLSSEAPILYWKFRVEAIRLRAFGSFWGLDGRNRNAIETEEVVYEVVYGILRKMQTLFGDVQLMSQKFGFESIALIESGNEVEDAKDSHKSRWSSKFKWAFSDKGKASTLLKDIRELNDGLYTLLRISELRAVDFVAQSQILRASADSGAAGVLKSALVEDCLPSPSSPMRISYSTRQLLLGATAQHSIDEQGAEIVAPAGTIVQSLHASTLQTSPDNVNQYLRDIDSKTRTLAQYEAESHTKNVTGTETVLIEWKDVDTSNPFLALIANRIDALANLLSVNTIKPSDFRVLDCVGYFHDVYHSRYGLLFRLPPFAAPNLPATLNDILARQSSLRLPELGDRFALAQAISQSILRLHDCGWVHRGLRASNILIFKSRTDTASFMLRKPLIVGFTYSRPNDPKESTLEYSKPSDENDLYHHPDILRSNPFMQGSQKYLRYEQRHDLFSLGIVLLEIGLWDQAKAFKKPKYTPEKFLEKLVTAYVPLLGHRMGATYRDVVLELLTGSENVNSSCQDSKTNTQPDGVDIDTRDNAYWPSLISRLMQCRA